MTERMMFKTADIRHLLYLLDGSSARPRFDSKEWARHAGEEQATILEHYLTREFGYAEHVILHGEPITLKCRNARYFGIIARMQTVQDDDLDIGTIVRLNYDPEHIPPDACKHAHRLQPQRLLVTVNPDVALSPRLHDFYLDESNTLLTPIPRTHAPIISMLRS